MRCSPCEGVLTATDSRMPRSRLTSSSESAASLISGAITISERTPPRAQASRTGVSSSGSSIGMVGDEDARVDQADGRLVLAQERRRVPALRPSGSLRGTGRTSRCRGRSRPAPRRPRRPLRRSRRSSRRSSRRGRCPGRSARSPPGSSIGRAWAASSARATSIACSMPRRMPTGLAPAAIDPHGLGHQPGGDHGGGGGAVADRLVDAPGDVADDHRADALERDRPARWCAARSWRRRRGSRVARSAAMRPRRCARPVRGWGGAAWSSAPCRAGGWSWRPPRTASPSGAFAWVAAPLPPLVRRVRAAERCCAHIGGARSVRDGRPRSPTTPPSPPGRGLG